MNTQIKPILLSINICDRMIREEKTHKTSLIGMFNNIGATKFPCLHPRLHVHVAVTGGSGKQTAKLCFVNNDLSKLVMELKGPIEFRNRVAIVDMNFEIANLPLEAPGLYHFEVWIGETLIGHRCFNVKKIEEKRGKL